MAVRVCFEGRAPGLRLSPWAPAARSALLSAHGPAGAPLPVDERGIALSQLPADACIDYAIDVRGAARSRDAPEAMIEQSTWLWRPEPRPARFDSTIRFELSAAQSVVVPWPRRADGAFVLTESAFSQRAHCAFGDLAVERVDVPGSQLEVTVLDRASVEVPSATIRRWLTEAASAVTSFHGGFPFDRVAVVVIPVSGSSAPVAFGLARRGGGASIMLLLDRRADPEALVGEWVAVHELSHLLAPPLPRQDAWMAEGMATYLQEVLRARRGLITESEAWANLVAGFGRGRAQQTGRTLADESANMRRTRAFLRVYWAGTAFWLEADLRLRRAGRTLAGALEGATRRLGDVTRVRPARAVAAALDEASGTDVFTTLRREYMARTEFPPVEPLLEALGVRVDGVGHVALDDEAPDAAIRRAIMSSVL